MVASPPVVAARPPSRVSASRKRADDQAAHQAGIAEAHLGLGRMHVHVDLARIERDEQRHHRMAVARQIVGVGGAHRADQQLVAHRPVVDEQILPERIGAGVGRQGGKAFDGQALAPGARPRRHWRGNPRRECRRAARAARPARQRRGPGHRRALLARQREGDIGPAHRQAPHDLAHGLGLRRARSSGISAAPAWRRTGRAPRRGCPH